jgi:hypothetical protein
MFWTDRGPKYLLILVICSLVIYMTSSLYSALDNETLEDDNDDEASTKAATVTEVFNIQMNDARSYGGGWGH